MTGDFRHLGTVEIDVTNMLAGPVPDLKGAVEAFDYDGAPHLENLTGPAAAALKAVFSGPTEVHLSIGDFLIPILTKMGCWHDEADDKDLRRLLTRETLDAVLKEIDYNAREPAPFEIVYFKIDDEYRLAGWDPRNGWLDLGTAASETEARMATVTGIHRRFFAAKTGTGPIRKPV
jgi:hypothetical protein